MGRIPIRLLSTVKRAHAIDVLRQLVANDPTEMSDAVQALMDIGEAKNLDLRLLRDIAMLAHEGRASEAITTLMRIDDKEVAVPAAIYLFAMCQRAVPARVENHLNRVMEELLSHGYSLLALAAANWLALRPGYFHRFEACQLLLEGGRVE